MKKKYEIPRLNIKKIKKNTTLSYSFLNRIKLPIKPTNFNTKRNNTLNKLNLKSKNNKIKYPNKYSLRFFTPLLSDSFTLSRTFRPINTNQVFCNFINDNPLLSSYKVLNINKCIKDDRLKTTSTRYSERTLRKDNFKKLIKKLENKKKMKNNNKINHNLIKIKKEALINFIPSPLLLDKKILTESNIIINNKKKSKEKSKKIENIKNNNNNNSINKNKKVIKDENLPIFLREKYNIKGTNIISPFCIKARDEFLYKRIFYTYFEKPPDTKKIGVNNKLNIIYAESEEKFKKKIYNLNRKFRKQGKKEKNAICPNSVENKLNGIKNKIRFMKKIVDYAYPETILTRLREENKNTKNSRNLYRNLPPFKTADFYQENENKTKTENLTNSLTITKA